MDLTPSKGIVAWLRDADEMLHEILVEAETIILRAAGMPAGSQRDELLRRWALLADGANHVALTAVEIAEGIADKAKVCLEVGQRAE